MKEQWRSLLIIVSILLTVFSCSGMIGEIVTNRIIEKMNRIDHYKGEVKILGEENSKIRLYYRKRWHIHQEVLEPKDSKGEIFVYDGSRFVFYSPNNKIAFLITGIQGLTDEDWRLFIRDRMEQSKKTHTLKSYREVSIMGRKATIYKSSPKVSNLLLPVITETWIDDSSGIPLKSINYKSDGSILRGFELTHIDFESPLPKDAFNPHFLPDTRVITWDLRGGGLRTHSWKMSFHVDCIPERLSLRKRIVPQEAPEILLSFYEGRPYFLILIQWPEGSIPLPFSGGCMVSINGREYRLLYYSGLHLVDFKWKGSHLFLFSNLTLNDLLDMKWIVVEKEFYH